MKNIIIISCSGRALATAAYLSGYQVHVLDCFVDEDTKAISTSTFQLQYHCDGFEEKELFEQVSSIVSRYSDAVIVIGTGFEKTPALLDSLTLIAPVLCNDSHSVQTLKDPVKLAALLNSAAIKTPELSLTRPANPAGWLIKKAGGIGGAHVQWLSEEAPAAMADCYYQRYTPGVVASAVFLAMKTHAIVIGYNEQLQTDTFSDMPFLHKGVVTLNELTEPHKTRVEKMANQITKETGLKGLCGIDYIVTESGELVVLEINPRPPGSHELYEQAGVLFDAHLACFYEGATKYNFNNNRIRGYAVCYAEEDNQIDFKIDWPDWVTDIPPYGSKIDAKFPICTVHAEAESLDDVKLSLEEKLKIIKTTIKSQHHAIQTISEYK